MEATDSDALSARLAPLHAAYGQSLQGKLGELRALANLLAPAGTTASRHALEELRAGAHRLAGTAPTFGFAALGRRARQLEALAAGFCGNAAALDDTALAEIEASIAAMAAAIGQPEPFAASRCVALIATTAEPAESMARLLEVADFTVLAIHGDADITDLVIARKLHAILIQAGPDMAGALTLLARLRAFRRVDPPLVFFAQAADIDIRLAALRAGGTAFLADPMGAPDLPARLAALIAPAVFRPFRVLSLGGDAPALDPAIFATGVLTEPARLFSELRDFRPELLLLADDASVPRPADLARLVWQEEGHRDIDIFFRAADAAMRQAFLAAGITDRYVIPPGGNISAHIIPWLHARRAGQLAANAIDLAPHLVRLANRLAPGMAVSSMPATAIALTRPLPPARTAAVPTPRPKILVVDDDRYLVSMLANALAAQGADVLRAYDGGQGFDIAWRELPRAIVTDVEMPGGTGDRMILQLRRNPRTASIPVLVMTHRRWEDGKDHALERDLRGRLGAAAYMQKPIEVEALLRELARL